MYRLKTINHRRSRVFFEGRHLKKNPTQGLQWSCCQGFAPSEPLAEFLVATRNMSLKPLTIRPRTLNALDADLKRTPVTGN
jgi:hypothetical protein